MKPNTISLLVLPVLLVWTGCQKEDKDYRTKYYGDYTFEVVIRSWSMSFGVSWDTTTYDGLIRKYKQSDSDSNRCFDPEGPLPNPKQKISIRFLEHFMITSGISEEGLLTPKSCSHYYHEGGFTHHDTISFSILGLGGLGGGSSIFVTGVRK